MQVLDDAQHRIAREASIRLACPEQRAVVPRSVAVHRQRRERHQRQRRVDGKHGDDHAPDRARHRARLVAGLLGHVGDRLDARVGDHPDGNRHQEAFPRRGDAEMDVVDEHLRREHERDADDHQEQLRGEVRHRQDDVQSRRLADAHDVDHRQKRHDTDPEENVAGPVPQRGGEQPAQIVRHEERRDGDRDRVVEHLRPGGEEGRELVEGAAGEGRRAARLRVHRRRLGVRGGGQVEDPAGQHEHDRRQPERERRDQAERVVDRRADVAVGRREQRGGPEHPFEPLSPAPPPTPKRSGRSWRDAHARSLEPSPAVTPKGSD